MLTVENICSDNSSHTFLLYSDLLKKGYNISLEKNDYYKKNEWGVRFENKNAFIYVGNDIDNIASLTHELLHIQLHSFGYPTLNELHDMTNKYPIYHHYLGYEQRQVTENFANFFAHYRMINGFQAMGFKREEFNANKIPISDERLSLLSDNIQRSDIVNRYVAYYISYYFFSIYPFDDSVRCDFDKVLSYLKKICPEVYLILENIRQEWEADDSNYDIKSLYVKFIEEVQQWASKKKFFYTVS